jgi:hypothetical protein
MGPLVHLSSSDFQYSADILGSGLETLTLVISVVTFALLVGECQSWDAEEDAVADVLTSDEVAAINSLPRQDSAIIVLRVATWLAGGNSVFFFLTLVTCSMQTRSNVQTALPNEC